jgi:hypothetical protein
MNSVHAEDFGVRHRRKLTDVSVHRSPEAAAKPSQRSCVARAQHEEHPLATSDSIDNRSGCGAAVAGYDEIDRSLRALHR